MAIDWSKTFAVQNGAVTAVTDAELSKITLSGQSTSTTGASVVVPLDVQPGRDIVLTFKRSHTGTWYDDDSSDAVMAFYFLFGRGHHNIPFSPTAWVYNRPVGGNGALIYARRTVGAPYLFYDAAASEIVATNTCQLDGSTETKIVLSERAGYVYGRIYTAGTLHARARFASGQWVNGPGALVFHYHNYNNTSTQVLSDIDLSYIPHADYEDLLQSQDPRMLYTCKADSGTSVLDSSGYGHNLVASSNASIVELGYTSDPSGRISHRVHNVVANGSYAIAQPAFNAATALYEDVTLSLIMRMHTTDDHVYAVTMAGSGESVATNVLYSLWFSHWDGFLHVRWFQEWGSGGTNEEFYTNVALPPSGWAHVVVRRRTSDKRISVFVNGVRTDVTYVNALSVPTSGQQILTIGGSASGSGNAGEFDFNHLAIFAYALSDAQILQQYYAAMAYATAEDYEVAVGATDPAARWRLNESAGESTVYDYLAGINMVVTPSLVKLADGTAPTGLQVPRFVDSDHSYSTGPWPIYAPTVTLPLVDAGSKSIAFMLRLDPPQLSAMTNAYVTSFAANGEDDEQNHILSVYATNTGAPAGARFLSGLYEQGAGSNVVWTGTIPLYQGRWYFVVCTLDTLNNLAVIYVDGVAEAFPVSPDPTVDLPNAQQFMMLGGNNTSNVSPNYTAAMSMSDVLWWKRALGYDEVGALYNAYKASTSDKIVSYSTYLLSKNPVVYNTLSGAANPIPSEVGRADPVRTTNAVQSYNGPFPGVAFGLADCQYTGSDGYFHLLDSQRVNGPSAAIGGINGDYSAGLWFKSADSSTGAWSSPTYWYSTKNIMEWRQESATCYAPFNFSNIGGKFAVAVASNHVSSDATNRRFEADELPNINDSQWHFLVFVKSGANVVLYVDGMPQYFTCDNADYSLGEVYVSNLVVAGRTQNDGVVADKYPGWYAGVFVLDDALTQTDVLRLMELAETPEFESDSTLRLAGNVAVNDAAYSALVRLYDYDTGEFEAQTYSDALTGRFEFSHKPGGHVEDFRAGGSDPYIESVTSLIALDSYSNIVDLMNSNRQVTVTGTPAAGPTTPFGGSSVYFPPSSFVEVAVGVEETLFDDGEAWTVEWWQYVNGYSGTALDDIVAIFDAATSGFGTFLFRYSNGDSDPDLYLGHDGATAFDHSISCPAFPALNDSTGAWHHIAFVSTGSAVLGYIDGQILLAKDLGTVRAPESNLSIFLGGRTSRDADVAMFDFRITKGVARYLRNFTPSKISTGIVDIAPFYDKDILTTTGRYMVTCDFGEGMRPQIHGPIVATSSDAEVVEQTYAELIQENTDLVALWMLDDNSNSGTFEPTVGVDSFVQAAGPTVAAPIIAGTTNSWQFTGATSRGVIDGPSFTWSDLKSVELWYRQNSDFAAATYQGVLDAYVDNSNRAGINRIGSSAPYHFPSPWNSAASDFEPGSLVDTTRVHHLVVQYNGTNTEVYIDGIKHADVLSTDLFAKGGDHITVGNYRYNDTYTSTQFRGAIAGLALYSDVLSQDDILAHYQKGAALSDYYIAVAKDAPVHWFPLNEASDATAYDVGGVHVNGTYSNMTYGGVPLAGNDRSVTFNGSTSKVALSGLTALSSSYSLELWINPTTVTPTYQSLIYMAGVALYLHQDKVSYYFSSTNHESDAVISPGTTYHVVLSVDAGDATIYVNGESVATFSSAPGITPTSLGQNAVLGQEPYSGYMSHVAMYNYALSHAQVVDHLSKGAAFVVPWTPDDIALSMWVDTSDESTVSYTPANEVLRLTDKTGLSNPFLPASGYSGPTYALAAVNGHNAIYFPSYDKRLLHAHHVTSQYKSQFLVVKRPAGEVSGVIIGDQSSTGFYLGFAWNGNVSNIQSMPTWTGQYVNGAPDTAVTRDELYDLVDGKVGLINWDRISITALQLGYNAYANMNSTQPFNGYLCEHIIVDASDGLPTFTRQKIEGYLAHKWGFAADLPAGHPFALSPPYTLKSIRNMWSPAQITTRLWFDASPAGDALLVSGLVSRWYDKSGNGLDLFQDVSSSYRPTPVSVDELGNKRVFRFDGTGDYMQSAAANAAGSTGHIYVIALASLRSLAASRYFLINEYGASNSRFFLSAAASGTEGYPRAGVYNSGTPYTVQSPTDMGVNGWTLYSMGADGSDINLYVDGLLEDTASAAAMDASSTHLLTVGSLGTSPTSYASPLDIAEIIVLDYYPTEDVRQRLEGYLAHKWGVTGSLPSTHPYKAVPPV